jgi:hypothetical protein
MAIYSNITVDQGSDFSTEIIVSDAAGGIADLTGYLVTAQLRKTYASSTAVDFTAAVESASQGKVSIALTSTQTNALKAGRYVYDVEIQNGTGGTITRIVEGQLTVTPGVTR